jgi:hypothetical protein
MTWLIGVPFSMILGIVAPYATLGTDIAIAACGRGEMPKPHAGAVS